MINPSFQDRWQFAEPDTEESGIRTQLEKIINSPSFHHALRMKRFLSYVVGETLAGRGSDLKEYTIALNVYDKPAAFDPRVDSIIRVEAKRLRSKLEKYYALEGQKDPLVIHLPKNSYVPRFCAPRDAPNFSGATSDWEIDYLKAKHFLTRCDPDSLQEAVRWFISAATKRPGFSLSMAGLASCYTWMAWLEFSPPEPVWSQAILCARRALGGAPSHRQALTTLACEYAMHRWEWAAAERQFQEVIEFDPTYVPGYQMYVLSCLAPQGRFDEALYYLQHAQQLERESAVTTWCTGRVLYLDRRFPEAVRALEQSIRLNPKLLPAYWHLGFAYAQLGEYADASAVLSACAEAFNDPTALATLGFVQASAGAHAAALESRQSLTELARTHYVSPVSFALLEIGLAHHDAAFEYLDSAFENRAARLIHLPVDPAFDPIKADSRFVHVLSRLRL